MKNVTFIGGIHGSGKGRICEVLRQHTDLVHLTASEVLKWHELSSQEEKLVKDINETQNRLINNLRSLVEEGKNYLLDGHYCLLNKYREPEKVSIQTFININPSKLLLVIAEPLVIKKRLEKRDSKVYEIQLIQDFQNLEIHFAKEINETLGIPLRIIDSQKFKIETLLNFLK